MTELANDRMTRREFWAFVLLSPLWIPIALAGFVLVFTVSCVIVLVMAGIPRLYHATTFALHKATAR